MEYEKHFEIIFVQELQLKLILRDVLEQRRSIFWIILGFLRELEGLYIMRRFR